jgi:ATP-binding cassette, subfamily B, bacterial
MGYATSHIIQRIVALARPYWIHLMAIFLLGLLATPIALLKPLALKIVIDNGLGGQPLPSHITSLFPHDMIFSFKDIALLSVCLYIGVALIENIYSVIIWILNIYTGEKLVLNFRTLLFNHVQKLSLAFYDQKGTSDPLYRIQYDTVSIRTLLISNFSLLLSSLITTGAMIVVMFMINWRFALVTISIIPPLFILTRISTARLRKHWAKVKEDESKAMSVVHEVLSAIRVVKAFRQEEGEGKRFVNRSVTAVNGQLKVARASAFFFFIVEMLFAIGTALVIYMGAMYVKSGQMTLGELTLVLAYLTQIFGPLEKISRNINDIQSSITSITRVFTLLDKEKEVEENPHPTPLSRITGAIRFQQVGFSYQEDKEVLKDISFEIKPGEKVGILGSTGAGKTTLISLLMRFYDPSTGKILVDSHDIRDYKLAEYRQQFGMVLQDTVLFSTTIRENIAYGMSTASFKDIVTAAKQANAHDFIIACQNGYDTQVGERGMQLSGGERQRISLARAFIKNAPVLILDEPTSSVDIKTEVQIMEAMERLMVGRTTFLISHRLDALKSCDVLLHIEQGKLVDFSRNKDFNFSELKNKVLLYEK